jgi:replication factor A1
VAGLNNISISGIITRVLPINEFDKNGKKGKVASVIINDGTGEARLVFWNEMTEIISSGKVNVNDFLKVHHVHSKQGNYGFELHLSARSRMEVNPEGERPKVKSVNNKRPAAKRFLVCDLQAGLETEIRACLVKLHDFKVFYDVCPYCGKSIKGDKCAEHGAVKPSKALFISGVFDDGSGTIRCVFFKQQAESLLGCSTDYAVKLASDTGNDNAIIGEKKSIIGDEFILSGRVNHNNFSDQLEMIVNSIVKADPLAETQKLLAKAQ